MPGQFKHLVQALVQNPDHEVVFITKPNKAHLAGVKKIEYKVTRQPKPESHRYLISMEKAVYQAQEVWRVCNQLRKQGFEPDILCAHPGWGDCLFLRDFYPDIPFVYYMEFYYHSRGSDSNFLNGDTEIDLDEQAQIRIRNSLHLMNLEACDHAITPTHFQAKQHPKEFMGKFSILHEGADTDLIQPGKKTDLKLPSGKVISAQTPLITYVTRNIEPYRGFPTFIKAVEVLMKQRPDLEVIVIGGEKTGYGKAAPKGHSHKELAMQGLKFDESRLHFLGKVPYPYYLEVLAASSLHIYLTVPFVLSWSLIEAMASGCCIVSSDTEPVKEVIRHDHNGLLCDFFDHEQLVKLSNEVLDNPERASLLRQKARATIEQSYALKDLLPLQLEFLEAVATGEKSEVFNKIETRAKSTFPGEVKS